MTRKRDKLDSVDAELIRETLETSGWQLIKRGLENMRDVKMRDLVRQHTETETAQLRGAIDAIERALGIPETLIAEAKNGAK